MNINLSTFALVLGLLSLIGQIWELVLMWKRKEFILFALSLLLIVIGGFFEFSMIGLLIIKIIFYRRYWSDISIRKPLYLQLIPVVVSVVMIVVFQMVVSSQL